VKQAANCLSEISLTASMATKMVIIVSMMLVGALARKYSQSSDALVAGKENNTWSGSSVVKKVFKSVPGNGWCTDAAGAESTARTKTLILRCKHAEMLCEKDSMCVAFACVDSKPFAVMYTTTNCGFACDKLSWIANPTLITRAGFDDRQEMAYWQDGACFVTQSAGSEASTALSTNCDFEVDLCGWSLPSDVKFVRAVGRAAGATSGPQAAHTGTGYAIASSNGAYANQKYVLESPYLANFATANEQALLDFWYQMEGAEQGTLSLKCTRSGVLETIWQHDGNQPDGWTHVTTEIPKSSCRFEADTRTAGQSDIAIDDVSITKQVPSRSCDFEADSCEAQWDIVDTATGPGWKRQTGPNKETAYNFVTGNGNRPFGTGPEAAAEGPNGYYLVLDSGGDNNPDRSFVFRTKPFLTSQSATLSFKYSMCGAAMGTLTVWSYSQDGTRTSPSLISLDGNVHRTNRTAWVDQSVVIPSGTTMIEFEAVTRGITSDMAIDEIVFSWDMAYP